MLNSYNIALLPEKLADEVVGLAKSFDSISDRYQLGEQSLPHVTICQFEAAPNQIDGIINRLSSSDIDRSIELSFKSFSCVSFDGVVHWASIMPDKVDELTKMHIAVSSLLGKPAKKGYDPHMTLMNTLDDTYESIVGDIKKTYTPFTDHFILTLGAADVVGQYLKVLHRFEPQSNPKSHHSLSL